MITYLYWFSVIVAVGFVFWLLSRYFKPKVGLIGGLVVFVIGWGMYYFHYEQHFVKNWGGIMSLSIPEGEMHMGATWKEDHLWIQNYDPKKNECVFREYAKGSLLEGRVVIKNCNPFMFQTPPAAAQ